MTRKAFLTKKTEHLRYRRLFETTHMGIFILDCKTRKITDVNPFFTKIAGYAPGKLLDKKISEINLFGNDVTGRKILKALCDGKNRVEYDDVTLYSKSGKEKIVELIASVYKEDGRTMLQCTVRDLTEKKRAQRELDESRQRLEALMNALPVGVTFSLDPKCERIEVNPYMKKQMEMESDTHITATDKQTLIKNGKYHIYHHLKDGRILKPKELTLQRAIAENRFVGPIEAEVELPSGKRWLVEAYGAPIRDSKGKVIGAVAVNVDLTERKKAEEAEKLALVIKQEKEKLDFIADAAHELRTPLAIIRGNVDLALQKTTASEQALKAINVEVIHLASLLSDLSLLTTKERDFRKNIGLHQVEIGNVVKNIAERHRSIASKKNISIEIAKLPLSKITGDEYYLERLFTNIISNAIAYGKESGHIHISGKIENNKVKILIEDDGIGIPEKDISRIFERFYRVEESRSKDYGGSGLGLAIVKWIAEAHGGGVEAASTLGKGSVFTVTFPLLKKNAK